MQCSPNLLDGDLLNSFKILSPRAPLKLATGADLFQCPKSPNGSVKSWSRKSAKNEWSFNVTKLMSLVEKS